MKDSFEVTIICGNCGYKNILTLKKGTIVRDYLRLYSKICGNCGNRIDNNTYTLQTKGL